MGCGEDGFLVIGQGTAVTVDQCMPSIAITKDSIQKLEVYKDDEL